MRPPPSHFRLPFRPPASAKRRMEPIKWVKGFEASWPETSASRDFAATSMSAAAAASKGEPVGASEAGRHLARRKLNGSLWAFGGLANVNAISRGRPASWPAGRHTCNGKHSRKRLCGPNFTGGLRAFGLSLPVLRRDASLWWQSAFIAASSARRCLAAVQSAPPSTGRAANGGQQDGTLGGKLRHRRGAPDCRRARLSAGSVGPKEAREQHLAVGAEGG